VCLILALETIREKIMLALALAYGLVFLFTTSKKGDIRKGQKTLSCNKGTNHNGNKLLIPHE
jgi:hypothetical protein